MINVINYDLKLQSNIRVFSKLAADKSLSFKNNLLAENNHSSHDVIERYNIFKFVLIAIFNSQELL